MTTKRLHLKGHEEALTLFGQNDEFLRDLERRYHVQFFVRPSSLPSGEGLTLAVRGKNTQVDKAIAALEARRRTPPTREKGRTYNAQHISDSQKKDMIIRSASGTAICPRSEKQKEFIKAMRDFDLVIGIGPAGTGKTFLSVAFALAELQSGRYNKIVLTRPVVEAGEKLGFLPGDFYEKVHPYLRPLYDAFFSMVGPDRFRLLREDEIIEIIPLAYMRGRTLDGAIIILDEAQNTTLEQVKMFLSRMGQNSKMIVNGDLTQIDLENKKKSGLLRIEKILRNVDGIHFTRFDNKDIFRHELVKKILHAFETEEQRNAEVQS